MRKGHGKPGKKVMASFLAATLAISAVPVAGWAEGTGTFDESSRIAASIGQDAAISREEALSTAKKFAPIPEGYQLERSRFHDSWYQNGPVWRFFWSSTPDQKQRGNINVVVDAESGEVLHMSFWNEEKEPYSFPPKVEFEQAKQIAQDYINRHFADFSDQVQLEPTGDPAEKLPLDGRIQYNFKFIRLVNGIPFPEHYIQINVNGNGEIRNGSFQWDSSLAFPDVETAVSQEEAEKMLKERVNVGLSYIYPWKYRRNLEEEPVLYLGYERPYTYNLQFYVDAREGNLLDRYGQVMETDHKSEKRLLAEEPVGDAPVPLAQELTQEQALEIIQNHFTIPEELDLTDASYTDRWNGQDISAWTFRWRKEEPESQTFIWINATVNAKTAEILEYSRDEKIAVPERDQDSDLFTREKTREKAIGAIRDISPHLLHQLYSIDTGQIAGPGAEDYHHFRFHRLVNGIQVAGQGVSVTVNAKTGEITRYFINWDQRTYPAPPQNLMNENEALDKLFEDIKIQLSYMKPDQRYWLEEEQQQRDNNQVFLVYRLVDSRPDHERVFLDAETGEWRSMETGDIVRGNEVPEDIVGHWAEKELQLMYQYNAFEMEDGHIYPDRNMKRGEIIKMLMLAMNRGHFYYSGTEEAAFKDVSADSAYFSYVQAAVQQNILDSETDELRPEEEIDREELAELITRALGYGKLAETDEIFRLSFDDADRIEAKGHVAIVSGLGIMNGNGVQFMPDKKVTRAEAAVAFYRFLEKRAELN